MPKSIQGIQIMGISIMLVPTGLGEKLIVIARALILEASFIHYCFSYHCPTHFFNNCKEKKYA